MTCASGDGKWCFGVVAMQGVPDCGQMKTAALLRRLFGELGTLLGCRMADEWLV